MGNKMGSLVLKPQGGFVFTETRTGNVTTLDKIDFISLSWKTTILGSILQFKMKVGEDQKIAGFREQVFLYLKRKLHWLIELCCYKKISFRVLPRKAVNNICTEHQWCKLG
jgi:hypothetical protein